MSFAAAFAETILRSPARQLIGMGEIEARAFATITVTMPIRLIDLTGPGLSMLGLGARIFIGPYDICGRWADALFAHPSRPDGILYPSRRGPSQSCVALFECPETPVEIASASVPLTEILHEVAGMLERYDKALDPP